MRVCNFVCIGLYKVDIKAKGKKAIKGSTMRV